MEDLIDLETKLSFKSKRLLDEYDLESLFDVSEYEAAIFEFKELIEKFEDTHVQLKRGLGEKDYLEAYPKFFERLKPMTDWVVNAKRDLRKRRREIEQGKRDQEEKESMQREKEVASQVSIERDKLRNRVKHLSRRIDSDLKSIESDDSHFIDDLNRNIENVKQLTKEFTDLFADVETIFGDDFETEFSDYYSKENLRLYDALNCLRATSHNSKLREVQVKEAAENLKLLEIRENEVRENEEKIVAFDGIYDNIKEKFLSFEAKCTFDFTSDESTILKRYNEVSTVDTDFNDILDWITELVKATPLKSPDTTGVLNHVQTEKERLKTLKNSYKETLIQEVKERDLTEEKMKNVAALGLPLRKFGGYNSSVDYYTFKSEFEKLVVPRIQSKLLPDYIKIHYLEGQALQIVKEIDNMNDIWERLKLSFGSVNMLLANKLKTVESSDPLWKVKGDDKIIQAVSKLKNFMTELSVLAEKHGIEGALYHSSNLAKIYSLIGKTRQTSIMKKLLDHDVSEKKAWDEIVKHLEKDLKIREQILLVNQSQPERTEGTERRRADGPGSHFTRSPNDARKCAICDKTDHEPTTTSRGNKVINYFSCEKFVNMTTKNRFEELKRKHLCFQCLSPGYKSGHEGNCFDRYKCPHEDHNQHERGLHVLICNKHKENRENIELLEAYKAKYITFPSSAHRDFSRNIGTFHVQSSYGASANANDEQPEEAAMYCLQTTKVGDHLYNLFFDNGCSDMICKKDAADRLISENRGSIVKEGPFPLFGVNDKKSTSEHGKYKLLLPLHDGTPAELTGLCLDKITSTFPTYPLAEVEKDIHVAYKEAGRNPRNLPKLAEAVGGDTHIMIGSLFNKWFPKELFRLLNGLSIYKSYFRNPDGSRGIVSGPHRIVTEIHKSLGSNFALTRSYLTVLAQAYRDGFRTDVDVAFLHPKQERVLESSDEVSGDADDLKVEYACVHCVHVAKRLPAGKRPPKILKKFERGEDAGTEMSYRCPKCRGCTDCLKSQNIELISTETEVQQEVINRSVVVDLEEKSCKAVLPFLCDPVNRLAPNAHIAKKVYLSVTKSLRGKELEKEAVRKADKKLMDLGFNDYLDNLSDEERKVILNSPLMHFLPWRLAWNPNSLSTPCRPVNDASLPTDSGVCINDLLAKGSNNMNPLLLIFLRWRFWRFAYHSDIQTMYNRVSLRLEHWCYQLYYYHESLDPSVEPRIKVNKTVTYGLKSSGNQAERGIRLTADLQKDEFPREAEVINKDTYVDDCLSGENTENERDQVSTGLVNVLGNAGFKLKGFTFSGSDPPAHLTKNGKSISTAGTNWDSKEDLLSLIIPDLNFCKKRRGKKSEALANVLPETFTRTNCASRVGEVYDLVGRFSPITAGFKLDLHALCDKGLDWGDTVPQEMMDSWKKIFEMISKLKEIRYRRAVVPEDAENLNMETIEMADASESLACSALYVRFKRKNGLYHCQLLFARTKILPKDMGPPRAELFAAELNATTGHSVYLALGKYITKRVSLTDSQITLFWICNPKLRLKKWTRGRVIEINRLTDPNNWYYVEGKYMTADLGTRRGAQLEDVAEGSRWANGEEWAKLDQTEFPIKSIKQIKLSDDDLKSHETELQKSDVIDNDWIHQQLSKTYTSCYAILTKNVEDKIAERYALSAYLLDPLKFRFRKVVRILALVILFVSNLKLRRHKRNWDQPFRNWNVQDQFNFTNDKVIVTSGSNEAPFKCPKGLTVELSEYYLRCALNYFFMKATIEIKTFTNKKSYKNVSSERNGVLLYTGRLLPSQKVDDKMHLADVCTDLSMSTFCVPLIDKFSPLAYAIVNEVHWYDEEVWHSGNETVWRHVLKIAFIFEGRSLVAQFRTDCPRCNFLNKKHLEVSMGPVSDDHLCIAPAFYNSQIDLFGPFSSYSFVNKRATIKIWFVIFCCCTTGAVDLKVMDDYSTPSFVLAFTRFSCKVGYPKKLLPDAGSQLVKGCDNMRVVFSDVRNKLNEFGILYEVCPVGAHYMHGKVERKIRHVKESFQKHLNNDRLSVIHWESLGDQVANSINNLPIGVGNVSKDLENIDLITPNRLLFARNNDRCPAGTLVVSNDLGKLIEQNNKLFTVWFRAWLVSYVPSLMLQPKWFNSDRDPKVGDVVLFLKSDKEFEKIYQYGMICDLKISRDHKIRQIEIEYQNVNEATKRRTTRGTREVVVIHPVHELGLVRELNMLASKVSSND